MLGINSSSAGTYNASSGGGSTEEKDENSGMTMGSPNGGSKKSGKGEKSKKGKKSFVRVKDGEEESAGSSMCCFFYDDMCFASPITNIPPSSL